MFRLQIGSTDNLLLSDLLQGPLGQLLAIVRPCRSRIRVISVVAALDDHLTLGYDQVVLAEVDFILFVRLVGHSLTFIKFDSFIHIFGYFLVKVLDGCEARPWRPQHGLPNLTEQLRCPHNLLRSTQYLMNFGHLFFILIIQRRNNEQDEGAQTDQKLLLESQDVRLDQLEELLFDLEIG